MRSGFPFSFVIAFCYMINVRCFVELLKAACNFNITINSLILMLHGYIFPFMNLGTEACA
jgi:hypothetical protein